MASDNDNNFHASTDAELGNVLYVFYITIKFYNILIFSQLSSCQFFLMFERKYELFIVICNFCMIIICTFS